MIKHGVEFQREAVRIALNSGLQRKRVVADPGVGLSTLTRRVSLHRMEELPAVPDTDPARENERLRPENRVLREEKEVLGQRSSSRAKGREVRLCAQLSAPVARGVDVPRPAGQRARLSVPALAASSSSQHGWINDNESTA